MSQMLSNTFNALNKEAQFTRAMLGAGATQIRQANYTSKGLYFQAFTNLSTGLERIGKLCLMLDYFIDHGDQFPSPRYMKSEIGHNLEIIYEKSALMVVRRSFTMSFLQGISDPVHLGVISILSQFAMGDRYSNINLLVGNTSSSDPISAWFNRVDQPLLETRVAQKKKDEIRQNAAAYSSMLSEYMTVLHTSETGKEVTDIEEASYMTGIWNAVAPYRQLYVLQIIRYWVELLLSLQYVAMKTGSHDIPFFTEIFAHFYNDDSYIKTRKTWDKF